MGFYNISKEFFIADKSTGEYNTVVYKHIAGSTLDMCLVFLVIAV